MPQTSILNQRLRLFTLRPEPCASASDPQPSNGAQHHFIINANGEKHRFNKVLLTVNCPTVLNILNQKNETAYWHQLDKVEYLGVVCILFILSRSLSPFYVINLLDKNLPFTGIIEATNVVRSDELDGNHLVYLPKYLSKDDPITKLDDEELIKHFTNHLQKVFPDLKAGEVKHTRVFREPCVQPLQELFSLEQRLTAETPISGLYVTNTAMILNSTLNNNAVITLAKRSAEQVCKDITLSP